MKNRFCVYLHRKRDDLSVFYVGCGTHQRAHNLGLNSRNADWAQVVKHHGVVVEIVKDGLTKSQAEDLEILEISRHTNIVNKKKTGKPEIF